MNLKPSGKPGGLFLISKWHTVINIMYSKASGGVGAVLIQIWRAIMGGGDRAKLMQNGCAFLLLLTEGLI